MQVQDVMIFYAKSYASSYKSLGMGLKVRFNGLRVKVKGL